MKYASLGLSGCRQVWTSFEKIISVFLKPGVCRDAFEIEKNYNGTF